MTLLYCFSNASLTRRVLAYLHKKLRRSIDYVTVIFFNDCWIVHLKLMPSIDAKCLKDCQAVFCENGLPYQLSAWIDRALKDLDNCCDPTAVMNHHQIAIVSHGAPQFEEVEHFRQQFVKGLGYCPPSLA